MERVSSHAVSRWSRSPGCCVFRGVFWVGQNFFVFFFLDFFFLEPTRPAASMRPSCLTYLSTSTGVRTGCHYVTSLCLSVCVCVTLVVFSDYESCTRPISTNPESMEACEYELTGGTCFVARRLEVVAFAGLLWISWCVLGAAGYISCSFVFFLFFFLRTHTACCKYEDAFGLIYLSTSIYHVYRMHTVDK